MASWTSPSQFAVAAHSEGLAEDTLREQARALSQNQPILFTSSYAHPTNIEQETQSAVQQFHMSQQPLPRLQWDAAADSVGDILYGASNGDANSASAQLGLPDNSSPQPNFQEYVDWHPQIAHTTPQFEIPRKRRRAGSSLDSTAFEGQHGSKSLRTTPLPSPITTTAATTPATSTSNSPEASGENGRTGLQQNRFSAVLDAVSGVGQQQQDVYGPFETYRKGPAVGSPVSELNNALDISSSSTMTAADYGQNYSRNFRAFEPWGSEVNIFGPAENEILHDTSSSELSQQQYPEQDGGLGFPSYPVYSQMDEIDDPQWHSAPIRDYVNYVRQDPTKTREEIKALLENIRPDMEIPPEDRVGTPDALVYPLMEHQKIGLAWLKKMEESKHKGSILADDMGLGKTIQALALIVSRKSEDLARKTTLIVAPLALLKQWEREVQKKLKKEHTLSVYVHHGGRKAKQYADLAAFDVVLTTFGTIASEYKRKAKYEAEKFDNAESNPEKPSLLFLGKKSLWYRVIVDEAQCIKNKDTQAAKGCHSLKATYRLCLSGTPMQNNCDELFSLLKFLGIRPYNSWSEFSSAFSKPLKSRYGHEASKALKKLQALLAAILLRRTKASMIDGKPILSLPPRHINMVHSQFSPRELEFYNYLEKESKSVYNKYVRSNAVGKNYSNLLVLLLRLRQACCHPHLINDVEEVSSGSGGKDVELAKELAPEVVGRIKQTDCQECPICMDATDNPAIVVPCGHAFCFECLLKFQNQAEQSALGSGQESAKTTCPRCRGELNPRKLIDLKAFRMVHQPESMEAREIEEFHKLFANANNDMICESDSEEDDQEAANGNPAGDAQDKKITRTLAEVKKDSSKNEKSKRQYHRYLAKNWVDSAKIKKCIEILEDIQSKPEGEKTIVFSQFTSLLDLLEVPLSQRRWKFRRYDGGMSAARRNEALIDFSDDPSIKIVLVSLKAGNAGLNLVAASQVIIFDPFYNPFIEYQAIDRAHRIGQQRPVTVHRLIIQGTVEDRVLALQEKKRDLIEGALDETASKSVGRLTAREIGFLFGIGH